MKVFFYLIYLTNCALLAHSTIHVEELNCESNDSLKWLWNLRNNNRCLSIITTFIIPKCFFEQVFNSKFVVRTISPGRLLLRNIYDTKRLNCDNFFIFSKNVTYINEIFQQRQDEKRFWPFSQIYLAVPETELDNGTIDYIHRNALNVFLMERVVPSQFNSGPFSFKSMLNVLTKRRFLFTSNLSDAVAYFGVYKEHPLLSTKSSDKTFRVSLFNCPPYVVYMPGNNIFDGLEYKILSETTRPWTIHHTKCDISQTIIDPWSTVLKHVNNGTSDLAMCSVWLKFKSNENYDATNYVDYQCGTLMVPRPRLVNPAVYLYLSLDRNVWIAFTLSFISTSIIMTLTARAGRRIIKNSWSDKLYVDFSRSFLDSMNVATSHGIEKFPKQESIKTLFTSWIVLSLIIGVAYTTGYASFLTNPLSTKPIDTLPDFLQSGMYWSVVAGPNSLAPTLNVTDVTNLVRLSRRAIEKNSGTMDGSSQDKRSALFVKIITNRYITDINEHTDHTYSLRIMKSCFLNYYSVVAFKKYSGYTKYFNEKIRAYAEFGLTEHWALNIKGANNKYMELYFLRDGKIPNGPTKLTITTLKGAFTLLWVGMVLATVIFLGEHLFSAFYSNKTRFKVASWSSIKLFSFLLKSFSVVMLSNASHPNLACNFRNCVEVSLVWSILFLFNGQTGTTFYLEDNICK